MLLIAQTNNPVRNPDSAADTAATGDAIAVVNHLGVPWLRVAGRGELLLNPPPDATQNALEITGDAASTKRLLKLTGKGAAPALEVDQQASGQYAFVMVGENYGGNFTVTESGGQVLRLTRSNTTGGGDVLDLRNDSVTGRTLLIRQNATEVAEITRTGEYENKVAGGGIVLKSPDGTRYRLAVANGGTVSLVAA